MESSIYANFDQVNGQNIVACFLKWNLTGLFSVKNHRFKICKKCNF